VGNDVVEGYVAGAIVGFGRTTIVDFRPFLLGVVVDERKVPIWGF
jgi:hypothetical protein